MPELNRSSVVRTVANALRSECLAREEGELLGSEEDLFIRYGVSRPSFRQAAALLAQEQLLAIKRGVGGGYFASRPQAGAVAHITAIYLQSRETKIDEIFLAIMPLRLALSQLAARSSDQEARAELAQFLAAEREHKTPNLAQGKFDVAEYREFLKSERDFCEILGRMANNKVLHLFLEMLNKFFATMSKNNDIYLRNMSRAVTYREMRMRIVEAILDGDEPLATLLAERCGAALSEWLAEDKAAWPRRRRSNPLFVESTAEEPTQPPRPRPTK